MFVRPSEIAAAGSLIRAGSAAAARPVGEAALAAGGRDGLRAAVQGVEGLRIGFLRCSTGPVDLGDKTILAALAQRGVDTVFLNGHETHYAGDQLMSSGRAVGHLDAVLSRYARDAGDVLDEMEARGMPLINNTRATSTTSSKINSELAYRAHGANSIPTEFVRNDAEAGAALTRMPESGSIVVKPFDGESGDGVEFFTNQADARAHIASHFATSDQHLIVQPRIEGAMVRWTTDAGDVTESGMDYRGLLTLDNHDEPFVDAVLMRVGAPGSGKSNLDAGGWGKIIPNDEVPPELIESFVTGYKVIPGTFEMGGVDVMPIGRSIDQPLTDHRARGWAITETNSSPGIPDINYGSEFGGALADRMILKADRARTARLSQ